MEGESTKTDTSQELNNYETGELIPEGVFTLDDIKKYGQEKGVCPYFTIRRMVGTKSPESPANIRCPTST